MSNRIIILLSSLLISSNVFSVCLKKNFTVDSSCKCSKSNSCFNPTNKKYKSELKSIAKNSNKKMAKKIHSLQKKSLTQLKQIFSGNLKLNLKLIDESNKRTEKIRLYNKRNEKKVNKAMSKYFGKKYNYAKRVSTLEKRISNSLPVKTRKYLNKVGLSTSFKSKRNKGNTSSNEKTDKTYKETMEKLSKASGVPLSINIDQSNAVERIVKTKDYKYETIYPKSINLFDAISSRYRSELSPAKEKVNKQDLIANIRKSIKRIGKIRKHF